MIGFAARGDARAVPVIRELQRLHRWPHGYLVDGRHVVPLGRWADVVCTYLEGGCDALREYARWSEPDSFSFAVSVLEELKSAVAAKTLAELAGEVAAALPKRLADAKKLAEAINFTMSFDEAPRLDRATAAKLRSFLHDLLNQRPDVVWRMTAVYALRGVGDEESLRMLAAMHVPPDQSRDVAKVIKILQKRLGAAGK